MAVNNEVGTITDLAAVSGLVRERAPKALLHTDAVQAAYWLDLRAITPLVDLMSLSAHKFGGPEGRRRAHGARRRASRADHAWVAARSASAAAARTTSPGSSPSPRRCASPTPIAIVRTSGCGPCATGSSTASRPQLDGVLETVPREREGRRVGARVHRGHRERGAALPARRGRRVRVGAPPRARAARWSRRTSSRRWASTASWSQGALRMSLGHTSSRGRRRPRRRRDRRRRHHAAASRSSSPVSCAESLDVKVLLAMSGGVDSSVAGARLLEAGPRRWSASRCGCGAARATPDAAASPTSTTHGASPSNSRSTTSCSTSATTSTSTSSTRTCRRTSPAARRTRASSATAT